MLKGVGSSRRRGAWLVLAASFLAAAVRPGAALRAPLALPSAGHARARLRRGAGLNDWVVEGLDADAVEKDAVLVGEGDEIPDGGLVCGSVRVLPAGASADAGGAAAPGLVDVRLGLSKQQGWGSGCHPTTRLCLELLSDPRVLRGGELVLDMGCGSGVLSAAALALGADRVLAVDVEAEALLTTQKNLELNFGEDPEEERWRLLHAREVVPGGLDEADIIVANILVGQLRRPSMVSALVANLRPDGVLCLSGIRPGDQCETLREAYARYIEWDDALYDEAEATAETGGKAYWGSWARLVGRRKRVLDQELVQDMSELAVS